MLLGKPRNDSYDDLLRASSRHFLATVVAGQRIFNHLQSAFEANSMASRQVYLSGHFVSEEDAKISIFDSAVTLGYTVTESTRTFAHRPFKLERHIARLYKSLKAARIDPGRDPAELTRITLEVLEANRPLLAEGEDCWIVHNISAGVSAHGPDPSQSGQATLMIFTAPMDLVRSIFL